MENDTNSYNKNMSELYFIKILKFTLIDTSKINNIINKI